MKLAVNSSLAWVGAWQTQRNREKLCGISWFSLNHTSTRRNGLISALKFPSLQLPRLQNSCGYAVNQTYEDWFSARSVSSRFLFSCTSTRAGTTKGGCQVQRLFTSREVLHQLQPTVKLRHQPHVLRKPGHKLTPVQVYKSLPLFRKSISKVHLRQKCIGCHLLHCWHWFSLVCATRFTTFWRYFIYLDGNTFATSYICSPFSFRVNLAGQRLWGSLSIPRLRD